MNLSPNILFDDRYLLLEMKGRGSYGEVWRAKDSQLGLDVAVKVYIALDQRGVQEFKSEFVNTFGLSHPNLLHAYYYDICEDRPYLVMPYCPKSSIDFVGNIEEYEMWRFIHDVASGLSYLHEMGVVHHDIKPDNILMDDKGNFLITDFGISVRFRSTLRINVEEQNNAKMAGGSLSYMAPEMFSNDPVAANATDVWALGVTMYEMLTGELPFFGQGGVLQLNGAMVPRVQGNYSENLKAVVRWCLALNTWDRPMAKKLASVAQAVLNGEKVNVVELEAEENRKRAKEEARRKAEEEARRKKAEEEARRKAEEEARRKAEEEARRKKAEEEARRKAEEEARRKAEEEARRKAEEEARRKAEEEARRKAEEEARRKKAEEEARRKAEEEARRKAEEEARRKAEEEARRKAEEEARRKKAEEEARRKAEEEARRKAEEEARKKAEEEAKRKKAEEEARKKAEEEAKRKKAEEEAPQKKVEEEVDKKAVPEKKAETIMSVTPPTEEKPKKKNRVALWLAIALLLLGGGLAYYFLKGPETPSDPTPPLPVNTKTKKTEVSFEKAKQLLLDKDNAGKGLEMLSVLVDSMDYESVFLMSRLYFDPQSQDTEFYKEEWKTMSENAEIVADNAKAHELLMQAYRINGEDNEDYALFYELGCDFLHNRGVERDWNKAHWCFAKVKSLLSGNPETDPYLKAIKDKLEATSYYTAKKP